MKVTNSWSFKTKLGFFWILELTKSSSLETIYLLGFEDYGLNKYKSPETAAQAVEQQITGFFAWDVKLHLNKPKNLSEWENCLPPGGEWQGQG